MTESLLEVGPLAVGGRSVFVETNDKDFAAVVERVFVDLQRAAVGEPLRLRVLHLPRPWPHWGIWRDGAPCETTLEEGYVLFQLQWELNRVVLDFNSTTVHAAAVAHSGVAVVLCGGSHSGKTTVAGWLAAHGWTYLADEVVALEGLQAAPYPRPLGLRHGGPLEGFLVPQSIDRRFEDYEHLTPASALRAEVASAPCPVGALVFSRYVPESSTAIEPVKRTTALELLCANAPCIEREGRSAFRRLAALVEAVPAYLLTCSELDPVEQLLAPAAVQESAWR